jgi:quinol monooxygenase YgiN
MVKAALLVRLEAKPGKEADVESFYAGIACGSRSRRPPPVCSTPGPSTFGIFDAFPDESGRQAHLSGQVAAALMARASELFSQAPVIEKVDVLAVKLPPNN